uniref:MARVEL domain-containing protein n=1 Tax=Lotharella globosa TaxID=91324 RepID=A0A7S3ZB69_9EUKA
MGLIIGDGGADGGFVDVEILRPDAKPFSPRSIKSVLRYFEVALAIVCVSLTSLIHYANLAAAQNLLVIQASALTAATSFLFGDFTDMHAWAWHLWPLLEFSIDLSLSVLSFCGAVALTVKCDELLEDDDIGTQVCSPESPVIRNARLPKFIAGGAIICAFCFAASVCNDALRLKRPR